MNRKEFMEKLEQLLWNIPDGEREEALQYYNDYFDDAGAENEAKVIEELVSPEQVARTIQADLSDAASEYTETGYKDTRFQDQQEVASKAEKAAFTKPDQGNIWKIAAIILLCVVALPVVFGIGKTVAGVIFAVIFGILGICIGIVAAGFGLLVAGAIVIGIGISWMFTSPPLGIALAGAGCLILALGILLSMLTVWCCVKLAPAAIRGIVKAVRIPFRKAGVKK